MVCTEYFIRKRNFRWWSKFNYVLSAGLDSGTILAVIVIFFTLQLPFQNGGLTVNWWGNVGFQNSTCLFEYILLDLIFTSFSDLDANPVPHLHLQHGQSFDGPPGGGS
jgi:hypothetical protein